MVLMIQRAILAIILLLAFESFAQEQSAADSQSNVVKYLLYQPAPALAQKYYYVSKDEEVIAKIEEGIDYYELNIRRNLEMETDRKFQNDMMALYARLMAIDRRLAKVGFFEYTSNKGKKRRWKSYGKLEGFMIYIGIDYAKAIRKFDKRVNKSTSTATIK